MRKKVFIPFCVLIFLLGSCANHMHFITDKEYRKQVEKEYTKRPFTEERRTELSGIMNRSDISQQEKEAMQFLYAYMPLSDLADYSADFFLDQVQYAFKAKRYFSWGERIPEDIFRHFVLVYRVNNENLDTARMVFFQELKDRVKGLSMYDAALEVNHWCHEKVTYRPSDSRTSAPLATLRTALGRCGEESTFAVTAMRAVGIPARQCYTPRWAHTDDNHAWVEVWIDGKWYFLGACEPDPELNMGWFAIPATRTMMVHSNAFGKYKGEEEINYQTELFSRINMLPNYTQSKKITVQIIDAQRNPIPNAKVKFKLYNYAEYYPIATCIADENGEATLTTGLGDLLIWASHDSMYNYGKIDVRKQDVLTLQLIRQPGNTYIEIFDIFPPKEGKTHIEVSAEKMAENNMRLHEEDSIRNAYTATFPTQDDVKSIANMNLSSDQIWEFIRKSEGNYAQIIQFITDSNNVRKNETIYLYDFLKALSDKDLRDCEAATLRAFVIPYQKEKYPLEVYKKGILPARISNELIRPYHDFLKMKCNLGDHPTAIQIKNWIMKHITIDEDGNYYNCPISPKGVFELKHSDKHSRDIFFVAVCRSFDIPAYLDNASNRLYAYENDRWNQVTFESEEPGVEMGTLLLNYTRKTEVKPEYWIHYTLAKFNDGDFITFDYENDPGITEFPVHLDLEPGYYMLSTGNRYSDGTTLSKLTFFTIESGKTTSQQIELRTLVPRNETHGVLDLNMPLPWKEDATLADAVKNHDLVLCFIDPNREPTRHLINDLALYKNQFEKWGGTMVFLVPTDRMTKDFDPGKLANRLPKNVLIVEDRDTEWMQSILTSTKQYFRDNYPLVFIVNKKGELTFKTEGYRIGTGELIYKSLQR